MRLEELLELLDENMNVNVYSADHEDLWKEWLLTQRDETNSIDGRYSRCVVEFITNMIGDPGTLVVYIHDVICVEP